MVRVAGVIRRGRFSLSRKVCEDVANVHDSSHFLHTHLEQVALYHPESAREKS